MIILSRGPYAYGNVAMDQLLSLKFSTGEREHTDLITGSIAINCLSTVGLEAERLAQYVARSIRVYRRNLQRAGFFYIGHLIQVGQESPPGSLVSGPSKEDWVNVQVTLPVYYQDYWKVSQNADLLAKIRLKVQAVARDLEWGLVYPDALNDDGTVNESSGGVIVQEWTVPPETPP